MASYNHKVEPVEGHVRSGVFRNPIWSTCHAGRRRPNPGCQKTVEFVVSYSYITGRAGRVTTNEKGRCREHAQVFANKHGIPGPDELDSQVDWKPVTASSPPDGVVVNTKIDDEKGPRNETTLVRAGSLWLFPDGSMYVYYRPTHWGELVDGTD